MEAAKKPTPNYLWSILSMKCPRCRRGRMFTHSTAYKKLSVSYMLDMPEKCEVCAQKYDMEPGFWYGTGYVSYALAVALSVASFVAWYIFIGISANDARIFYWLGSHILLLIVLQPWLMRLSRVIYTRFFIDYDPDYETSPPKEFK